MVLCTNTERTEYTNRLTDQVHGLQYTIPNSIIIEYGIEEL